MAGPRLSRRRKLVFALVPVTGLLVCLELGSRLVCHHRFAPLETGIAIQGQGRMASDPLTVWGNRPHYLEYDRTAQYSDLGVRVVPGDDLHTAPAGDDELMVVLLGGSAMAGMGSVHVGEWMRITGIATHDKAHSIDGYLEAWLSARMPDRRIRVLNAAVNCSTLYQSRLHARRLASLEPDWVVAMDGYNDPHALAGDETTADWVASFWRGFHYFHFPYRQARWIMSRSALAYLAGEYLFYKAGVISHTHETKRDPEAVREWLAREVPVRPLTTSPDGALDRAVDAYERHLLAFHEEMATAGQRHLLLVQPEITARPLGLLIDPVERAVYNYTLHTRGGERDPFMAAIHDRARALHHRIPEIASMAAVTAWPGWVFVDYCHLTADANRRIAVEIGKHIASGGEYTPFAPIAAR